MRFGYTAKKTPVTLLATAIGLALQMTTLAALAQDAPAKEDAPAAQPEASAPSDQATTLDSVTVTGFRGSLEKALEIKRSEVGVVDAIVAEDIADFPDLNLAESLQRIPGVSISRDAGEGRNISVRGPEGAQDRVGGHRGRLAGCDRRPADRASVRLRRFHLRRRWPAWLR